MINASQLRQWGYCRRVAYYKRVFPSDPRETAKMQSGRAAQEWVEGLEMRRTLERYGLSEGRRTGSPWLSSEALGMCGKPDLVIEGPEAVVVVEFKLTGAEVGYHHRLQIAAYAMLVEEKYGRPSERGFLYRIPDDRVTEVAVGPELREAVRAGVREMERFAIEQIVPEATEERGKCRDCEYANYCGDVW